jgi:hypothetical protein
MSANLNVENSKPVAKKNSLAAGIILVAIGLGLLLFQIVGEATYFPLVLGGIFLVAGVATRKPGFIIPGGIISGVGLGAIATMNSWFYPTNSVESGGVFLLFFSIGWFAITLLTALFTAEKHTWALVPGTIMAGIGGLVLMGERGTKILETLGTYWPAILVIIGAAILIKAWRNNK